MKFTKWIDQQYFFTNTKITKVNLQNADKIVLQKYEEIKWDIVPIK